MHCAEFYKSLEKQIKWKRFSCKNENFAFIVKQSLHGYESSQFLLGFLHFFLEIKIPLSCSSWVFIFNVQFSFDVFSLRENWVHNIKEWNNFTLVKNAIAKAARKMEIPFAFVGGNSFLIIYRHHHHHQIYMHSFASHWFNMKCEMYLYVFNSKHFRLEFLLM